METGIPLALRIRPMEAAVMPLPSELVTPPVTKTYFGIGLETSGVFPMIQEPRTALLSRGAPACRRRLSSCGRRRTAGCGEFDRRLDGHPGSNVVDAEARRCAAGG